MEESLAQQIQKQAGVLAELQDQEYQEALVGFINDRHLCTQKERAYVAANG